MDTKSVAIKVVAKYFKKNKMAMCLRDILPSSGLSLIERQKVADIVHDVVRWKKLYEYFLEENNCVKNPEAYVDLVLKNKQNDFISDNFEIKYSVSAYVASILKNKTKWIEYLNEKPPTTLCVNFNKSSVEEVTNLLEIDDLTVERSNLETAIQTSSIGRYSSAVSKNFAHVQDENSQLISYIAVSLGGTILDFCAGNGGKSLAMASISRNTKKLYAYDVNPRKQLILERRLKDFNAEVMVLEKPSDKKFDVVLVDAPCTGIGAARRNPEVKYVNGPGEYPDLQQKILEESAKKIKDKGYLLYCVCTFTPDETQNVVKNFLKENKFRIDDMSKSIYSKFLKKAQYGVYTSLPKGDIFFASLLKKTKK